MIDPQPTEDDVRHNTSSMNGGKQPNQTPLREKQPSRTVDETPNDNEEEESGSKRRGRNLAQEDQGESSEHKSDYEEAPPKKGSKKR